MLPNWVWFILEIIIAPLVLMALENRFSVFQRLTRIYYWLINKKSGIEITLWLESDKDFNEMKKDLTKVLGKEVEKVKKDDKTKLELKLTTLDLNLRKHSEGIYILETDKINAGIRDLKHDLREFVSKVSDLKELHNPNKINNISMNLFLPYKWKYIKAINPQQYKMKDYEVNFENNKYKCIVNLNFKRANFKNVKLEQLTDVLNDFTKIF